MELGRTQVIAFSKRLLRSGGAGAKMKSIQTERLLLRPWKNADLDAFAEMNADWRVMEHFGSTSSRKQRKTLMARIRRHFSQHGSGFWAVEVKGGDPFAGFVGLRKIAFDVHFSPAVEIGWRLAHAHWGLGYATEAASAALRFAFLEAGLDEIVSFTNAGNHRSTAVMERIGMHHAAVDDFDHPYLPEGHPLRRQVLYRLRRSDWLSAQSGDEGR